MSQFQTKSFWLESLLLFFVYSSIDSAFILLYNFSSFIPIIVSIFCLVYSKAVIIVYNSYSANQQQQQPSFARGLVLPILYFILQPQLHGRKETAE